MGLERGNGSAQPWTRLDWPEFVKNFMWDLTPERKGKVEQGREHRSLPPQEPCASLRDGKEKETKLLSRKGGSRDQSKPGWPTPTLQVPEGPEQSGGSCTL